MSAAARDSEIALALVASLDNRALDLLAEALAPRLAAAAAVPGPVVYTVATLALELGISERAIRAAIHRGELDAVKRGRTYLIGRDAVEAWAALGSPRAPQQRPGDCSSRPRPHRAVMAAALARVDGGG